MISYDPRGHDFESWASLMTELFAQNQVQIPQYEDDWRDWALSMYGVGIATQDSLPHPDDFSSWREWGERLVGIVNIQVN